MSLQAVHDVAGSSLERQTLASDMLTYALNEGTPAVKARARHIADE